MSRHHRDKGEAKGPAWERQRRQAFDRAGHRCQRCGRAGRLECHHRTPISQGGANELWNLEVMCRACHIDTHRPQEPPDVAEWLSVVRES